VNRDPAFELERRVKIMGQADVFMQWSNARTRRRINSVLQNEVGYIKTVLDGLPTFCFVVIVYLVLTFAEFGACAAPLNPMTLSRLEEACDMKGPACGIATRRGMQGKGQEGKQGEGRGRMLAYERLGDAILDARAAGAATLEAARAAALQAGALRGEEGVPALDGGNTVAATGAGAAVFEALYEMSRP
jgi:hypothetical protein